MADEQIQFVDDTPEAVLADAIADYQQIAGVTLGEADPEMLLINSFAYRGALFLKNLNYVGNQNLIKFATGVALEQLAAKFGVYRLPASPARVVVTFTMAGGAPTLVIPAGTRVKAQNGNVLFQVDEDTTVESGTATIDINCTCLTTGVIGNGYVAGLINVIVDPVAYVSSAANSETSTGGSDEEDDIQMRARVPLANATYSVAGPEDAYRYFALSASASIVDVMIPNPTPTPGTVYIYPLLAGGVLPGSAELDAVAEVCSDKKVRPLNDTVVVEAPTKVEYAIVVALQVKKGYNSAAIQATVTDNINGFVNNWKNALGVDIKRNQIIGKCMVPGVFDVELTEIADDIEIAYNEFGYCTGVTVTVSEIVDEP